MEKVACRGDKKDKPEFVRLPWQRSTHFIPTALPIYLSLCPPLYPSPSPFKDVLVKVNEWVTEQKKEIRFGQWTSAEVGEVV